MGALQVHFGLGILSRMRSASCGSARRCGALLRKGAHLFAVCPKLLPFCLIPIIYQLSDTRLCRRLFHDPVVALSIFILMGCDVSYMGAFLCMPLFLTEAAGLSIVDTAQILACRPAFGSVISLILAKLMGEKNQEKADPDTGTRPGCANRCTVSNLSLTLAGCCVSVIGCATPAQLI